jgi:hypothetical protein
MRVTDVAARLGVSVSTTHRLPGMVVYRGFAEQLTNRRYGPGPVPRGGTAPRSVTRLRAGALPHLRELVESLGGDRRRVGAGRHRRPFRGRRGQPPYGRVMISSLCPSGSYQ